MAEKIQKNKLNWKFKKISDLFVDTKFVENFFQVTKKRIVHYSLAGLLLLIGVCDFINGDKIDSGKIDGCKFKYREHVGLFSNKNLMKLKIGDKKYKMFDYDGSSLNWNKLYLKLNEKELLEKIVMKDKSGNYVFKIGDYYSDELKKKYVKSVFKQSNGLYNAVRKKIWENCRKDYDKNIRSLERELAEAYQNLK